MTLDAPEQVTGVRRYLPGLASIVDGARHSAVGDSRAALTVWAVVVPQSLAYATLAGLPSVHGLYAAVGALAAYAVFGTCRDLSMGAESTVALMAAAAVAPVVVQPEDAAELAALGIALLAYPDSFLTPLFENLPLAVLAGIVIVAGLGLFALDDFKALWRIRRSEFWLGTATVAAVLVLGMLGGIVFAIGLSLVVALGRVVRPHTAELGLVEGTETFRDIDRNDDAHPVPGLLVYRMDDELFFANAAFFVRDVKARLVASDPPATALVIDAEGVSDIDTTAIQQLDELLDDLDDADVKVVFARVRKSVMDMVRRSGMTDRLGGDDAIFLEVDDAVDYLTTNNEH